MPGHLWFHIVAAGRVTLSGAGEPVTLDAGDLALVTQGAGHRLGSDLDAPAPGILDLPREEVSEHFEILLHGGRGELTRLMCGAVRFDHPAARNLVALLREIIAVDGSGTPDVMWMQGTLALIAGETRHARPGGEVVITRLADVLVIQAIRWWLETDPGAQTGWLGALRDPLIGHPLTLIHDNPARAWTVAALADELAMSRSAFAARFTEVVGEPVMQYVTRWHMRVAIDALRGDGATIAQPAHRLGYRSEAAFARAFKRVIGVAPGTVKRAAPAGSGR